jgi:hypothetical protein
MTFDFVPFFWGGLMVQIMEKYIPNPFPLLIGKPQSDGPTIHYP